jgi:hypothetical protein
VLQVKAFTGGGFKLGSESQPSVAVGQSAAGGPPVVGPRKFILKMWQVSSVLEPVPVPDSVGFFVIVAKMTNKKGESGNSASKCGR